jgi:putative aminopeptidase FrvX
MDLRDLIVELCRINGPSGFEGKVAQRMRKELEPYVDRVEIDSMGNLISILEGEGPSLMVAAHMDQVALYVEYVDENNLVYFLPSGLIDPKALANVPVLILSEEGEIPGVVSSPPHHFQYSMQGRTEGRNWIDIGERKGVRPGDMIVYDTIPRWLDENTLASKSIDSRVSCALLASLAKEMSQKRIRNRLYLCGAVQEEIGSRGMTRIVKDHQPDYVIVIDTGFAWDPSLPKRKALPPGSGPVLMRFQRWLGQMSVGFSDPVLEKALEQGAREHRIPLNYAVLADMFNDVWGVEKAQTKAVSTSLTLPRRYSHSPYEVIDVRVVEQAFTVVSAALRLLAEKIS